MYIRITTIPPGDAPEKVRRAWIGMILEVTGHREKDTAREYYDVSGTSHLAGYQVDPTLAILALDGYDSAAYSWWKWTKNAPSPSQPHFVFPTETCQEVPAAEALANYPWYCTSCSCCGDSKHFKSACPSCGSEDIFEDERYLGDKCKGYCAENDGGHQDDALWVGEPCDMCDKRGCVLKPKLPRLTNYPPQPRP